MTAARRVLLLPREHGAYAQLALPMLAALGASRATLASACIALAACSAFLAHEPALVLLGHRGRRAHREAARAARFWLAGALGAAVVLAALGVIAAPRAALATIPSAATGAVAVVFVLRRRERTLEGELVAGAALASAAVPIAIAGALSWPDALAVWAVFAAAFASFTVEVRRIAHRPPRAALRAAVWLASAAAVAPFAVARPLVALASVPVLAVVAVMAVARPKPTSLRRLGWSLVAASVVTTVAVVGALRVGT